jgi:uncharacterized protein with GYD domain
MSPAETIAGQQGMKAMAKYISLLNWTDQGIKSIKDSPKRIEAARALAKKHGCEMKDFYLTIGAYDMVTIIEAPDDETAAKLMLTIASGGNVRSTTLKALSEDAFKKIAGGL